MKKLSLVLFAVENNDYQAAQVAAAKKAAVRLGVELQVIHIEHSAIAQSQQVLELLQRPEDRRPSGILFEPVGTPLAQAARLAASSGVAWVILNREVDYAADLRRQCPTPFFSVSTSHLEVGKIQGQQIARLLPDGGMMLYIQGPADNAASVQRTAGMESAKPANLEVRALKGLWTEESARHAVSSWLKLGLAKSHTIGVVAAQNDMMALGARQAMQEHTAGTELEGWMNVPFLGCDGLPGTGQNAVRTGILTATVVIPPNAGTAIEAVVSAIQTGQQPAQCIYTSPTSFPPIELLKPRK
jgi:ABC-type sugar transport system substrate-binding protein